MKQWKWNPTDCRKFFSWLVVPPLAAWLTVPGFSDIIKATGPDVLKYTVLFGVLWGFGGLTYGLGVRYLGMSLGNSVVLGFCSAFGALVPSIYYNFNLTEGKTTLNDLLTTGWGQIVLGGVILCLVGIFICGKAGMMKEKELSTEENQKSVAVSSVW